MSSIGIQNACISALKGRFSTSWFRQCCVAPLPPRFRNFLNEAVKSITLLPRVHNFSIVTTDAQLSVLLSTSDLHHCRWQSGEICQVLSTGACTLFCHVVHGFKEDFISFFVTFVLVSCSRVCLLYVSRLLGLILRHFAPVCSCRRDSLTRWRLAIAQEAARVISFCVLSIGL